MGGRFGGPLEWAVAAGAVLALCLMESVVENVVRWLGW